MYAGYQSERRLREALRSRVVGQFHDANPQRPEPPRTRSTTKAFGLTHLLRVPSWPWWLAFSQTDPLLAAGQAGSAPLAGRVWMVSLMKSNLNRWKHIHGSSQKAL